MEKTYKIEVDCANCAAIIERNVAKLKCIREVTCLLYTSDAADD